MAATMTPTPPGGDVRQLAGVLSVVRDWLRGGDPSAVRDLARFVGDSSTDAEPSSVGALAELVDVFCVQFGGVTVDLADDVGSEFTLHCDACVGSSRPCRYHEGFGDGWNEGFGEGWEACRSSAGARS